jgi:hypothetical protein
MKVLTRCISLLALASLVLLPVSASAQSSVATAEAAAFVGSWTISVDSPQGPLEQMIDIKDASGKLSAQLTSPIAPGPTEITDISKSGSDLVLKFAGDFQGQAFTAAITLAPESDSTAKVTFDVMDGMFVMAGTGAKK